MPRVPTYDNLQTQVSAPANVQFQGPQGPQAGAIAAEQAGAMGQALQGLGGELGRIVVDQQQKADQALTDDAINQLVRADTDLRLDALKLTGRAALDRPDNKSLSDEYTDKLGKVAADITANSLKSDAQRQAFKHTASQMGARMYQSLGAHILQQQKQFDADTDNATIETATQRGSMLWGDPQALAESRGAIQFTLDKIIERNGWDATKDKALIEAATTRALTPLNAGVISGMLEADNLDAARAYFAEHSAELTPQARLQLHDAINIGAFEKRSQDTADGLVAKYGADTAGALKEARSTLSGKDEDAVITRIKVIDSERVSLRERGQSDASDQAWRIYATTGSLRKIDPTILAAMDGRALESLRKTARADADAGAGGRKTNIAKWLEFTNAGLEQMAAWTPQDLMTQYGPYLSDADLKSANNMMMAARSAKGKGPANEEGLQLITTTDLLKRSAVELGVLPGSGTPTQKQEAEYLAFAGNMQQKVNAWEFANKKKASPEVLSGILNDAKMDKVKLSVWGSDPEQALTAVKADEMGKAYVTVGQGDQARDIKLSDVPAIYRASAVSRIQARGHRVTEQLIAEMWVADKRPKQ